MQQEKRSLAHPVAQQDSKEQALGTSPSPGISVTLPIARILCEMHKILRPRRCYESRRRSRRAIYTC